MSKSWKVKDAPVTDGNTRYMIYMANSHLGVVTCKGRMIVATLVKFTICMRPFGTKHNKRARDVICIDEMKGTCGYMRNAVGTTAEPSG
jgi:hypothetical protein